MAGTPRIPQFYAEQNILVTGGTGFIGKGLVEKLLRSCPEIGNIYLLMRRKGKNDVATRTQKYLNDAVFDRVRKENSKALNKVKVIPGDIASPELGLSPEDRQMLQENVSIVFHCAASVQFDDPLKKAFCINVKGTVEMLQFAKGAKKLKVFLHVSTTFSNCDRSEVNEVIYPAPMDWKKLDVLINETDQEILNILTPKILGDHPNTYTFTKALAEHVLLDYEKDMPIILLRPSIVVPALNEPFPGWVDNFNGPVGINIASGIGLIRIIYGDPDSFGDHIPIDAVIKAMIAAVWEKCVFGDPAEISIYNAAANARTGCSNSLMHKWGAPLVGEIPFMKCLWVCGGVTTKCKYWYYINVLLFHVLPGLFADACLKLSGNKPRLMKLHRIGYKANMALHPFASKMWKFNNERLCWLNTRILPQDEGFSYTSFNAFEQEFQFRVALLGARRFLFKVHDFNIPAYKEHYNRIWWADQIVRQVFITTMLWLVYKIYTGLIYPKLLDIYVDITSP